MDYCKLCILFALFATGLCASLQNSDKVPTETNFKKSVRSLMLCALTRDAACFLDSADSMVEERMTAVLAQADLEVSKATGRADEENSPSQLSKVINRIISDITDMFKDGLAGFFKSAREGEDDEVEEEEEKDDKKTSASRSVGEARKKKKKGKLIGLIKLIILGIVLKAKLTLLLKALSAALQLKFFLVALAGLILNAARFYLDLKNKHHPQKVIYYEHAQHQHHYDDHDDWSSGPGGSPWGRAYEQQEGSAQDLAYAKQKPYRVVDDDQSSFSWFG